MSGVSTPTQCCRPAQLALASAASDPILQQTLCFVKIPPKGKGAACQAEFGLSWLASHRFCGGRQQEEPQWLPWRSIALAQVRRLASVGRHSELSQRQLLRKGGTLRSSAGFLFV